MARRIATSGVMSTLTTPIAPDSPISRETPRDSQIRFCRMVAPGSTVLYG